MLVLLVVVGAFVSAAIFLRPPDQQAVASVVIPADAGIALDFALEHARDESPRSSRDVYPYSVIPGGVASVAELAAAIADDPPVTTHYGDITPAAMHVETVDAPREAYMSYRIGDQIYWTKRKLALHPGERVLTDGRVTIRGRCGNRLSDAPVQPTSDAEPPVAAFERDPAPILAAIPDAPAWNSSDALPGIGPVPPAADSGGIGPLAALGLLGAVPVFGAGGGGGGGFVDVGPGVAPIASGIADPSTTEHGEAPPIKYLLPPVETTPDGEFDDPDGDDAPGVTVEIPGLTPGSGGGDETVIVPGPHGGGGELPTTDVVPEPTSLTLLGTGIVWMAARRRRARAKSTERQ